VHVVVLEGHGDPQAWADYPHVILRFGLAAQMLDWLRARGVRQLVLSGRVTRPSFLSLRPDAASVKLAARIGREAFSGDDAILTAVLRVLRQEGFEPIGGQEILSELLTPPGLLGGPAPDAEALADMRRGIDVVRALGGVDVGQAAVVQQGLVLAVEAIEGTDAMLLRAGELRRDGPGGVLVKLLKPRQDRRVDLPTIGPETVVQAARAGLRGIVIEAEGGIIADRGETLVNAERYNVFLLAVRPDDYVPGHAVGEAR
jgi:hypothetical protein